MPATNVVPMADPGSSAAAPAASNERRADDASVASSITPDKLFPRAAGYRYRHASDRTRGRRARLPFSCSNF
jgi:hypothetical protein